MLLSAGTGALLQNLVLTAQAATGDVNLASVSSSVMFFYTRGGTTGLVVLGAVRYLKVSAATAASPDLAAAYQNRVPTVFALAAGTALPALAAVLAMPRFRLAGRGH